MERASAPPPHPDQGLLRRFLAGDAAACRQLERWAHEVLLHHRLGLSREEREDAVQDVLAGVWRAAGQPGYALPARGPGPEAHAEGAEEAERLHAALAGLDAPCRDIIRLHYFEDWTYARIAERERRREATMRVRMFNCLRALRERLGAASR